MEADWCDVAGMKARTGIGPVVGARVYSDRNVSGKSVFASLVLESCEWLWGAY